MSVLADFTYQTRESWLNNGPPREAWSKAGQFFRMLSKVVKEDWTGTGIGKLALHSVLGGAGGSNFNYSYNYAGSASGVQFEYPIKENFDIMRIDQITIELLQQKALVESLSGVEADMLRTAKRSMKAMSSLVWSDGSGLISKGDGAYDVTGNVITFKNKADANKYEKGDRLILASEAAKTAAQPGVRPATRAFSNVDPGVVNGYLEVVKVGRSAGTVQTNVNVDAAVPTAVNTDWIGRASSFGGGRGCIDGVFTFVPITGTDANKTLYAVDRSDDPERLAGWRIPLDGTESPWDIVSKMGAEATLMSNGEMDGDEYCIFVPAYVITDLMLEMKAQGITYTPSYSVSDINRLCMGVKSVSVEIPGFGSAKIIADSYLTDSAVTQEEDKTYVMLNVRDWALATTDSGYSWKDYDQQGSVLRQIAGGQDLYGQFGCFGNIVCQNPGFQLIASPRAGL